MLDLLERVVLCRRESSKDQRAAAETHRVSAGSGPAFPRETSHERPVVFDELAMAMAIQEVPARATPDKKESHRLQRHDRLRRARVSADVVVHGHVAMPSPRDDFARAVSADLAQSASDSARQYEGARWETVLFGVHDDDAHKSPGKLERSQRAGATKWCIFPSDYRPACVPSLCIASNPFFVSIQ